MIITTNYKAREFGVRSGIPGFIDKKNCRERQNFLKYWQTLKAFRSTLFLNNPFIEEFGLDEANLVVKEYHKKHNMNNDAGKLYLAQKIWKKFKAVAELMASCGFACNKNTSKGVFRNK